MAPHGKYEDLKNEIETMGIRPADMGNIKGMFEYHFFGTGDTAKLSKDMELTYRLWKSWYEKSLSIIHQQKLESAISSRALDRSFQEHFGVRLPRGRHITPELCHSWHDMHLSVLADIWTRRQSIGSRPQGSDKK